MKAKTSVSRDFISFALPDIGEEEIAEVVDSLRSGWITSGPKTKQFENEMSEFLGGGLNVIAVNSATAGLHLALEAIGLGPGDQVITTTHTFTATAEVVRYMGADPVFVDVDLSTYCIDANAVESAVTEKTKAIIPVHYAGLSCDMDRILQIADTHGLRVIEDAAHSIPATYNGELIGALKSDATVFSFYATKPVATGEGGMIVTRDAEIAARARVMRLHGIDRDAFDRYTSTKPSWAYDVVAPGFKYNMTDLAAAIGIHQLRKAGQLRNRRQIMAERYDRAFRDLPLQVPPRPSNPDLHSWHLYVVRLLEGSGTDRDAFIKAMFSAGVGCSVHYIPLHRQSYWRDTYKLSATDFPNSEELYEHGVSLPLHTKMTDKDQERVIETVREILRG